VEDRVESEDLRALLENAAANGIELDTDGLNALLENRKSNTAHYIPSQNPDPKAEPAPKSLLEQVRKGVCLDLSKVDMSPAEVKLVTLILTGRLRLDDIGPIIMHALNSGTDLSGCLEEYTTLTESRKVEEEQNSTRRRLKRGRQPPLATVSLILSRDPRDRNTRSRMSGTVTEDHRRTTCFSTMRWNTPGGGTPRRRRSVGVKVNVVGKRFARGRRVRPSRRRLRWQ